MGFTPNRGKVSRERAPGGPSASLWETPSRRFTRVMRALPPVTSEENRADEWMPRIRGSPSRDHPFAAHSDCLRKKAISFPALHTANGVPNRPKSTSTIGLRTLNNNATYSLRRYKVSTEPEVSYQDIGVSDTKRRYFDTFDAPTIFMEMARLRNAGRKIPASFTVSTICNPAFQIPESGSRVRDADEAWDR
jgi:hypothetical protein